jgi:hypothetical protein
MRGVGIGLLMVCLAASARSQQEATATFKGRIRDGSDSGVVSYAQIQVSGARSLRSNNSGEFTISKIPAGSQEVSVRMLGYAQFTDRLNFVADETVTRDIYLTRVPRLLSQMVVKGRSMRVPSGFEDVYQRGANGAGSFLTREQIDSLNPRDVIGLLHEVPFVHINANSQASNRLTTSRCRGMIPGSPVSGTSVTVYFNGVPVTNTIWLNDLLEHTAPSMIQAVEVYNGSTTVPPVFQPACAAIAIWTRKG